MHTIYQRLLADLENGEAQLRAQEEELEQRDAEISRVMGELRQCQAQLHGEQVCRLTNLTSEVTFPG